MLIRIVDAPRSQVLGAMKIWVCNPAADRPRSTGVIPTILAEQAIVDIISEQQAWLAATYPALQPKYLFLGIKNQHRGQRPRSYTTYRAMLDKLDSCHDLTDSAGHRLKFTQTHRLRHTRATELLNDGVPFHVVQRYLGHKSPEMTARYAATLA